MKQSPMAKTIISVTLHFILAFKTQVETDFPGETILTETEPFINVGYTKNVSLIIDRIYFLMLN